MYQAATAMNNLGAQGSPNISAPEESNKATETPMTMMFLAGVKSSEIAQHRAPSPMSMLKRRSCAFDMDSLGGSLRLTGRSRLGEGLTHSPL